jgi:hypothetical protein
MQTTQLQANISVISSIQRIKTSYIPYNYPVKGNTSKDEKKNGDNEKEGNRKSFVIEDELNQKAVLYKITYYGVPQPKIDKCSFTYPIQCKKAQKHIEQYCKKFEKDFTLVEIYQYGYGLLINNSVIRIHFKPKYQSHNFIRLEWNPAKLIGYEYELKILINELIFNFDSELVKVSRLDAAIDYSFIKPKYFIFRANGIKKIKTYTDKSGLLETFIMGSQKSQIQFVIYDKTKQLFKCGSIVTKQQIMRIEARLKYKSLLQLNNINPFARIQIFYVQLNQNIDSLILSEWWQPDQLYPKYQHKLQELTQFINDI